MIIWFCVVLPLEPFEWLGEVNPISGCTSLAKKSDGYVNVMFPGLGKEPVADVVNVNVAVTGA
jgi:hypothetical protein